MYSTKHTLNVNTQKLAELFENSLSLQFPCDMKITSNSLHVLLISSLWMGRCVGVLHYQNKNKQQQY